MDDSVLVSSSVFLTSVLFKAILPSLYNWELILKIQATLKASVELQDHTTRWKILRVVKL